MTAMTTEVLLPNVDQVRLAWNAINQPGEVREIRIPKPKRPASGRPRFYRPNAGWFDNADDVVRAVGDVRGEHAEAVYVTVNRCDPELQARVNSRLAEPNGTTTDELIIWLDYLFLDIDADRLSGISATDEEKAGALAQRDAIIAYLSDVYGWPDAYMVGDSGNGGALLYRVNLENTPENVGLIAGVLKSLAATSPQVDETTFNPARLMKLPGTISAKGDGLNHRPWRVSSAIFNHDAEVVSREQLEQVAADAPQPMESPRATSNGAYDGPPRDWTVEDFLQLNNVSGVPKQTEYGTSWDLDRCLSSDAHSDGACIVEAPNGRLGYRCQHDTCIGITWSKLRESGRIKIPTSNGTFGGPINLVASRDISDKSDRSQPFIANVAYVAPREKTMFPDQPDAAVYQGFAGEIVAALEPETEADPVALLFTLLATVGNIVGPEPHFRVGTRPHPLRIFGVLVGETAKGRKGTAQAALAPVLRIATADANGTSTYQLNNIADGLSSGEGLIWAVRDPIYKLVKIKGGGYEQRMVDQGVDDKRLLVVEEEFASVLRVMGRDGNTLSPVIRKAWDDGNLRSMVKNSPAKATGAHISIIGHVTRDELRRHLTSTEMGNGFANRFIWVCVRRSRLLPDGGDPDPIVLRSLGDQLGHVLETVRHIGLIERDADARELWHQEYARLSEGHPGLLGAITNRAEAQVMRLAVIYAILDESHLVTVPHLTAALKLWDYIEASSRYIFGNSLGDPVADTIRAALQSQGVLTRTAIRDLFERHQSSTRIDDALNALFSAGLAHRRMRPTGGRPVEEWSFHSHSDQSDQRASEVEVREVSIS